MCPFQKRLKAIGKTVATTVFPIATPKRMPAHALDFSADNKRVDAQLQEVGHH
jgi:hypothetical protein